jgi:RNA polymerase sigma-70 factor (ECF subfamily)
MSKDTPRDIELIQNYLRGDANSFDTLYERYRRPLYSYLNKMLPGQPSTVDDLFQKTWTKALKHLEAYHEKSMLAWLSRIAHNTAIDHFRRTTRKREVDIDDQPAPAKHDPPWRQMKNTELSAAISEAVDQLPLEQREVFILRQQDISFKEIAGIQKCSINTALGRMRYAVLTLRKHLQEWK